MKKKAKPKPASAKKCTLEALYIGESVNVLGDIQQVLKMRSGRELKYSGLPGLIFGESYYVNAAGAIDRRPRSLGQKQTMAPTERERAAFELNKELVKHARLKKQKAMQVKKPHQDIVRALELLRPFMRDADAITIRRFSEYLANQLTKGRRK